MAGLTISRELQHLPYFQPHEYTELDNDNQALGTNGWL